jgi:hypothetical protein
MALEQKRRAQVLQYPMANVGGIRCFCEIAQEEDELITAFARKRVNFPGGPVQALADQLEKSISEFISQAVVDRLEAIQVDPAHSEQLVLPPGVDHRLSQPVFEEETIG